MNWYLEALRKYSVFEGRARRKEYWFYLLFNLLISLVLGLIDRLSGLDKYAGGGLLGTTYALAMFVPGLAVTVRRLHDTDHSGWWLLVGLVPCVGGIILLVFTIEDSDPGENEYGPNPKRVGSSRLPDEE